MYLEKHVGRSRKSINEERLRKGNVLSRIVEYGVAKGTIYVPQTDLGDHI